MAAAAPTITFEAGGWVWVPHDEHMFVPGKVMKTSFKQGEAGEVTLEDGKVSTLLMRSPGCRVWRGRGGSGATGYGRRVTLL